MARGSFTFTRAADLNPGALIAERRRRGCASRFRYGTLDSLVQAGPCSVQLVGIMATPAHSPGDGHAVLNDMSASNFTRQTLPSPIDLRRRSSNGQRDPVQVELDTNV